MKVLLTGYPKACSRAQLGQRASTRTAIDECESTSALTLVSRDEGRVAAAATRPETPYSCSAVPPPLCRPCCPSRATPSNPQPLAFSLRALTLCYSLQEDIKLTLPVRTTPVPVLQVPTTSEGAAFTEEAARARTNALARTRAESIVGKGIPAG